MAVYKRGAKWQVRIESALLPKMFFATFDDEQQARNYHDHIYGMLNSGVVPLDMLDAGDKRSGKRLNALISGFMHSTPGPAPSDLPTLKLLDRELGKLRSDEISFQWVEEWVKTLKLKQNLAPSSIRKRVESLARVIDWYIASSTPSHQTAPLNPLRMLPKGYSLYSNRDTAGLEEGLEAKKDVKRERRFAPGEEQRIREALAGVKNPKRERALPADPDFALLFDLILNTGMRLREAYWLRCEDYDVSRHVINVRGTKGHRGAAKPRTVPLVPALRETMRERCEGKTGLVFPFWDGDPETLANVTNRLSKRFTTLFAYADMPDFTEHDLRHEATCRWATMRRKDGNGWMWSELEICKIMGWTKTEMFLRYASLRSEDLSDRM